MKSILKTVLLLTTTTLFMTGCGGLKGFELEQEQPQSQKSYQADLFVGAQKLNLSTDIKIKKISGNFTLCNQPWSFNEAFGSVTASNACGELVYQTVDFEVLGKLFSVKMGSSVYDLDMRRWEIVIMSDGKAVLAADFDREDLDEVINLSGRTYSASVDLKGDDGIICDSKNPFSVFASSENQVVVKLNAGSDGYLGGTLLKSDDASVSVDLSKWQFTIDLSSKPNGQYVYKNLRALKGRSSCVLNSLTINYSNAAPPAIQNDELHVVSTYGTEMSTVTVNIDNDRVTHLALSSYNNVIWRLTGRVEKLKKVYLKADALSQVTGVNSALIEKMPMGSASNYSIGKSLVVSLESQLKMKVISSQFTYESLYYTISSASQIAHKPIDELHLVSTYSGAITLDIQRTGKPIVLVLTSYENVSWNFKLAAGVNIVKVYFCSYHECYGNRNKIYSSAFLGISTNIIQRMSNEQIPYFYEAGANFDLARALAKDFTGLPVMSQQYPTTSNTIIIK